MALTKEKVKQLFAPLEQGDSEAFFKHVAEQVDWTVMGTHPLAGHYTDKQSFLNATFKRLAQIMDGSVALKTNQVFVDGSTAIVELSAHSKTKNGLPFNNQYCWICRFEGETIVEVRAYLDSELVKEAVETNES